MTTADELFKYYTEAWSIILHAMVTSLKDQEAHIDAAMHGQTSSESSKDNEEPAAFFFSVFGLAFEVLTTGVNGSGAAELSNLLISLQAVECLVNRQYCGKVFSDGRILDELIRAFYRLALTAKEDVLEQLLRAIESLADSLQSISRCVSDFIVCHNLNLSFSALLVWTIVSR